MDNRLISAFDDSKSSGLALIVGVLMAVQGFGNLLTRSLWQVEWGLAAIVERWTEMPVPGWACAAFGIAGILVAGAGLLFALRSPGGR